MPETLEESHLLKCTYQVAGCCCSGYDVPWLQMPFQRPHATLCCSLAATRPLRRRVHSMG